MMSRFYLLVGRLWLLVACLATAIISTACVGDGRDETDCRGICNSQRNCVDRDFNARLCAEQCNEKADKDEQLEERVEECLECIEDRTCAEIGTSCDAICEGLRVVD